jgi:hypothetical protein
MTADRWVCLDDVVKRDDVRRASADAGRPLPDWADRFTSIIQP